MQFKKDRIQSIPVDPVIYEDDFWQMSEMVLIRHHRRPRQTLYVPHDEDCPLPTKWLDIFRTTETDLESLSERRVEDFWSTTWNDQEPDRQLSEPWVGSTTFQILKPTPPPNHYYVLGRLTRLQKTNRPDSVWPEVYAKMS